MKQLFGFGSLINTASLHKTAPHASDVRPAYVKGFRREFNLLDDAPSWNDPSLDGIAYCALDVSRTGDAGATVNGVLFTVDDDCLEKLVRREHGYKLVETEVYGFEDDVPLGTCLIFSACKNDGTYTFESPSQSKYLELCLEGTKEYGDAFYQAFLDSTFIGDRRLGEVRELGLRR